MRKLLVVLTMVALTVGIALADITFHLGPTFTNQSLSWTSTGDASGLGGDHLKVTIAATGTATYTCFNKGGNVAPGQKLVTSTNTGSQLTSTNHNGRDVWSLNVGFTPAPTVAGDVAGCPNGNWTGKNPVIQGTPFAVLTIRLASTDALVSDTFSNPSAHCPANTNGTCPGF